MSPSVVETGAFAVDGQEIEKDVSAWCPTCEHEVRYHVFITDEPLILACRACKDGYRPCHYLD